MNHSLGRAPKGALVPGETQHSAERRKVAGALQCSRARQYNLIWAFPPHCSFRFRSLLWGFLLYEDILKSTGYPLVNAQRCVRSMTNAFSRQYLAHRHTSEPLGYRNLCRDSLRKPSGSAWANAHLPFIYECLVMTGARRSRRRSQGQRGGPRREREGRRRYGGRGEADEDFLGPSLNTYWLNSTRERTMNLKMYSKAFMALNSCSLTPGFSALAT